MILVIDQVIVDEIKKEILENDKKIFHVFFFNIY